MAGAWSELVVLEKSTSLTSSDTLSSVFIYSFLSKQWRPGTDILGGIRVNFACASDVLDKWIEMPHMARAKMCEGSFVGGRFQVTSRRIAPERYGKIDETFDPVTWRWLPTQDPNLHKCRKSFPIKFEDGNMIVTPVSSAGTDIVKLPSNTSHGVAFLGERPMVVGSQGFKSYLLDLNTFLCTEIEAPDAFTEDAFRIIWLGYIG
ncbi:hypothetical protein CDL15_Pgr015556 [Punica granatum]|uniref:Uncharacterized protein n=1 Tax=Punica granatum TaxID=22663 RepID=A0A218W0T0_PUNGR|nr:hypothetical protein CDL15_Pgr015556 [Punica granatum]PKI71101.1 hypothetical protein CRG98_008502 [Punica granatum]